MRAYSVAIAMSSLMMHYGKHRPRAIARLQNAIRKKNGALIKSLQSQKPSANALAFKKSKEILDDAWAAITTKQEITIESCVQSLQYLCKEELEHYYSLTSADFEGLIRPQDSGKTKTTSSLRVAKELVEKINERIDDHLI